MIHLRLTDPQIGAIQCRDWSEEPAMRRQLVNGTPLGGRLAFFKFERELLAAEVNDASNAEDEHATELRREGELVCARLAARSARVLANLYGRILRA